MDLSLLMVVNHQAICLLVRTGKGLESPPLSPSRCTLSRSIHAMAMLVSCEKQA